MSKVLSLIPEIQNEMIWCELHYFSIKELKHHLKSALTLQMEKLRYMKHTLFIDIAMNSYATLEPTTVCLFIEKRDSCCPVATSWSENVQTRHTPGFLSLFSLLSLLCIYWKVFRACGLSIWKNKLVSFLSQPVLSLLKILKKEIISWGQRLRTLVAFPEDLGLRPSTHIATHNHL